MNKRVVITTTGFVCSILILDLIFYFVGGAIMLLVFDAVYEKLQQIFWDYVHTRNKHNLLKQTTENHVFTNPYANF